MREGEKRLQTCLLSLRVLKVPAHAKSFIGAVCNILLSIEPRTRS